MMKASFQILLFCVLCSANSAYAGGTVSDNQLVSSEILGYDLQYRVYLPEGYESLENLPVIYITDGQWYIRSGNMDEKIDKEIAEGRIEPVIAVFIDNRDPHQLSNNRRNSEFFCNQSYAQFFEQELVPSIDSEYKTRKDRNSRVILGLSFGGLNSACFGIYAVKTFGGIAMQSPALHPVKNLYEIYDQVGKLPIKIFLSTGSVDDNTKSNRRWHNHLKRIGYDVAYREIIQGHNWRNWRPLLDDVLQTFFSTEK
jgi:enterochelin esterase-like enzyme